MEAEGRNLTLFVQIFDRKRQIIEQVKRQIDSFDSHLLSTCLIEGVPPPPWLSAPCQPPEPSRRCGSTEALLAGHFSQQRASFPYSSCYDAPYQQPASTSNNLCLQDISFNKGDCPGDSLRESVRDGNDSTSYQEHNSTDLSPKRCHPDPALSLARIQRSKSRQKALEIRKSARALKSGSYVRKDCGVFTGQNTRLEPSFHIAGDANDMELSCSPTSRDDGCVVIEKCGDLQTEETARDAFLGEITRPGNSSHSVSSFKGPSTVDNMASAAQKHGSSNASLTSGSGNITESSKPDNRNVEGCVSGKANISDILCKESATEVYTGPVTRSRSSQKDVYSGNRPSGIAVSSLVASENFDEAWDCTQKSRQKSHIREAVGSVQYTTISDENCDVSKGKARDPLSIKKHSSDNYGKLTRSRSFKEQHECTSEGTTHSLSFAAKLVESVPKLEAGVLSSSLLHDFAAYMKPDELNFDNTRENSSEQISVSASAMGTISEILKLKHLVPLHSGKRIVKISCEEERGANLPPENAFIEASEGKHPIPLHVDEEVTKASPINNQGKNLLDEETVREETSSGGRKLDGHCCNSLDGPINGKSKLLDSIPDSSLEDISSSRNGAATCSLQGTSRSCQRNLLDATAKAQEIFNGGNRLACFGSSKKENSEKLTQRVGSSSDDMEGSRPQHKHSKTDDQLRYEMNALDDFGSTSDKRIGDSAKQLSCGSEEMKDDEISPSLHMENESSLKRREKSSDFSFLKMNEEFNASSVNGIGENVSRPSEVWLEKTEAEAPSSFAFETKVPDIVEYQAALHHEGGPGNTEQLIRTEQQIQKVFRPSEDCFWKETAAGNPAILILGKELSKMQVVQTVPHGEAIEANKEHLNSSEEPPEKEVHHVSSNEITLHDLLGAPYNQSKSLTSDQSLLTASKGLINHADDETSVPMELCSFDRWKFLETSTEDASILDQLRIPACTQAPLSTFLMTSGFKKTPDFHRSDPNELLEGTIVGSSLPEGDTDVKKLDASSLFHNAGINPTSYGGFYSDCLPARSPWDIERPSSTFPAYPWDRSLSSLDTSGMKESLNSELPCINEESETIDEVFSCTERKPLPDINANSNLLHPLADTDVPNNRQCLSLRNSGSSLMGNCDNGHRELGKQNKGKRSSTRKGKENQNAFLEANGVKRDTKLLHDRFSKPRASGKTGSSRGSSLLDKEHPRNNIVSNITSFIPLVQQKQTAAIVTGKKDIKVKALGAAEVAKRLAEKKENERKQKREALKLERVRILEENARMLELKNKKKEEERKKKEADMAEKRKRQREEEEKKLMERKRRCVEEAQKQQRKQGKKDDKAREIKEVRIGSSKVLKVREETENANPGTVLEMRSKMTRASESTVDNVSAALEESGKPFTLYKYEFEANNGLEENIYSLSVQVEESYVISPYKRSPDEGSDDEADVKASDKFVPSWVARKSVRLGVSRQQRIDIDEIFPRDSFCNTSEVLRPWKGQT